MFAPESNSIFDVRSQSNGIRVGFTAVHGVDGFHSVVIPAFQWDSSSFGSFNARSMLAGFDYFCTPKSLTSSLFHFHFQLNSQLKRSMACIIIKASFIRSPRQMTCFFSIPVFFVYLISVLQSWTELKFYLPNKRNISVHSLVSVSFAQFFRQICSRNPNSWKWDYEKETRKKWQFEANAPASEDFECCCTARWLYVNSSKL